MAKKNVFVSSADMGPQLVSAVVLSAEGSGGNRPEVRAAETLGVQLLGLARERPLSRTWRASKDGVEVAIVVVAEDATPAERELFGTAAEALHAAVATLPGVLRVRAIAPSRDALLTDLWTTGSARDLSALKWSPRRRVEFVLLIVRALEGLHALGMVHGCLCPANVLLDDALEPVVAEAGSVPVHALADRGGETALYAAFAAPEVTRGENAEVRSDLFSVGRILDDAVKGEDSNAALREIVRRCCAPDLAARYASAGELGAALESALLPMSDAVAEAAPFTGAVLAPRPPPERAIPREAISTSLPAQEARTAWQPARVLGFAGIGAVGVSLLASALLGGSSGALRFVLGLLLLGGAALATTLARPPEGASFQRGLATQAVLALSATALLVVIDPLDVTYRMAAQRHLADDGTSRDAAINEIVRMGRDFRGLSLAHQDLSGMDLTGADLRGVDLSNANLARTNLFGAEVQGASFDGAALGGATLDLVELPLANLGTATCDAATRLPHGWRCQDGHIVHPL